MGLSHFNTQLYMSNGTRDHSFECTIQVIISTTFSPHNIYNLREGFCDFLKKKQSLGQSRNEPFAPKTR